MSYLRLLYLAALSNSLLALAVGYLVIFHNEIVATIVDSGDRRLVCLIILLIAQALWSSLLFYRLCYLRLNVIDLAGLLFASDFLVIFLLALLPVSQSVQTIGFFLFSTLAFAGAIKLHFHLQHHYLQDKPEIKIVGLDRDFRPPAGPLHPLGKEKDRLDHKAGDRVFK